MKKNRFLYIVLLFSIIVIVGCSRTQNDRLDFDMRLNPILTESEVQTFLNQYPTLNVTNPKNIFFIFVDTLRDDYVNSELMPNVASFKRKSIYTERAISGATATHHSLFSLFFSRPSYERNPMIRAGFKLGSIPLALLKKAGYTTWSYSHPTFIQKLNFTVPSADTVTEEANNQMIFGQNTYLLDNSTNATDDYGSESYEKDNTATNTLLALLNNGGSSGIDLSTNKNLVILYLFSTHTPLSWPNTISKIDSPYLDNYSTFFDQIKNPSDEFVLKLKNSYRNASRGIDYQVNRLFSKLKTLGKYDDSIIVFFSDHGTLLYENSYATHGRTSREETSRIPIYYKLANINSSDDTKMYQGIGPKTSSLMDVFPTILDYLGIDPSTYGGDFYLGESLFSHSNYGAISVKPNGESDTVNVAFYNDEYKLLVEFLADPDKYGEILQTKSFAIKDIRDFYDRSIEKGKTIQETKDILKKDFRKIFEKIFLDYH